MSLHMESVPRIPKEAWDSNEVSGPDSTTVWPPLHLAVTRGVRAVVVTVEGGLDVDGAERLGHTLVDLIENQGNRSVVVDLRDVGVPDADAVRVLEMACSMARRRGAELTLSAPSPGLYQCLAALGLADAVVPGDGGLRLHPAGSARIHRRQGDEDDPM